MKRGRRSAIQGASIGTVSGRRQSDSLSPSGALNVSSFGSQSKIQNSVPLIIHALYGRDPSLPDRGEERPGGDGARLAVQPALVWADPVPDRAGRNGLSPGWRREGRRRTLRLGHGGESDAGMLAHRHGDGTRRDARSGRLRDGGVECGDPGSFGKLPDHAEGPRRGLPDGASPSLDALLAATRGPARAVGDRTGDPRLLLREGLRPDRLSDPDRVFGRRDVNPFRDRLLRGEGVSLAVGPVVPGARGRRLRQGLLLRSDLPRGEVQDAAPLDRVLDDRAGSGLPRVRGALRAGR